MTTGDKLTSILEKFHLGCCDGDYCENTGPDTWRSVENTARAHSAIINLFKSLVPEEKQTDIDPDSSGFCAWEWNECRSQMLAKIEELRK